MSHPHAWHFTGRLAQSGRVQSRTGQGHAHVTAASPPGGLRRGLGAAHALVSVCTACNSYIRRNHKRFKSLSQPGILPKCFGRIQHPRYLLRVVAAHCIPDGGECCRNPAPLPRPRRRLPTHSPHERRRAANSRESPVRWGRCSEPPKTIATVSHAPASTPSPELRCRLGPGVSRSRSVNSVVWLGRTTQQASPAAHNLNGSIGTRR